MVEKRVFPFCYEIIERIKKEKINVIISGHNNSLRALRAYLEDLNVEQEMSLENPQDDYIEYKVDCKTGKIKAIRNGVKK